MPKIKREYTLRSLPLSTIKLTEELPLPLRIQKQRHGGSIKGVYTLEISIEDSSRPSKALTQLSSLKELPIFHGHKITVIIGGNRRNDFISASHILREISDMSLDIEKLQLNIFLDYRRANIGNLVDFIRANPKLRELEIDSNNRIGNAGAIGLASVLPQTDLRTLKVNFNSIGPEGLASLLQVLPRTKLTTLDISSNKLGPEGGELLAAVLPNTNLQKLYIDQTDIKGKGALALARVLPNTKLTRLSFGKNDIGREAFALLAEVLPKTNLTALMNISYEETGGLAAIEIFKGGLVELSFDAVFIEPDVFQKICDALAKNKRLAKFTLRFLHKLDQESLEEDLSLAAALENNTTLRTLEILDSFLSCEILVGALKRNINLEKLDFNCDFLLESLKRNTNPKKLDFTLRKVTGDLVTIKESICVSNGVREVFGKAPVNFTRQSFQACEVNSKLTKEIWTIVTEILRADREDVAELNLGSINIEDDAAVELAGALTSSTKLEKLDFKSSVISEAGVQAMLDAAYISNGVREHFHQRPLKVLNSLYPHNLPEERKIELDEKVLNIIKEKREQDRGEAMDKDVRQEASAAAAADAAPSASTLPAVGKGSGSPLGASAKLQRHG